MTIPRDLIGDLLRHMEWADARVWSAVGAVAADDARLRALLTHIHTVQHAFLVVWRRGDIQALFQHSAALSSMHEVQHWAREYYAQAAGHLTAVTDDDLATPIEMPWAAQIAEYLGHPPGPTTLAETFVQVTSHSTYHRGQANARLREIGGSPPLVDYIAWLWERRPAPRWPT